MNTPNLWKRTLPAFGLLAVLVLVLFSLIVSPAAAAGIVVNSNADTTAVDGVCTLREAIDNANSNSATTGGDCAAGSGADTITFAADYTITLAGIQLPTVFSEMTITGNGAANTIIQANAAADTATQRVFEVDSTGNLTLDGVTVRHGRCVGGCATLSNAGGGILNYEGTLTVTNSTLSGNTANTNGGGGGISNDAGTATVTNSTLSGNTAGGGGGISNTGTAVVTNSTLSGNTATSNGGGISNTGTTTVTNSTVSGNTAVYYGGGIFNNQGGTTTVTNSTLSGNTTDNSGGGIYNIGGTTNVTNSTLSGNMADDGGGMFNFSGTTTVTNSTVSGNTANLVGDELYQNNGTVTADAYNVLGHSGQTNADAFFNVTPGASDFNATTSGTPVALANILDTTLADNGGPTFTHALVAGSPAIDLAQRPTVPPRRSTASTSGATAAVWTATAPLRPTSVTRALTNTTPSRPSAPASPCRPVPRPSSTRPSPATTCSMWRDRTLST